MNRDEIYEPFKGLKSQVELTPPRPGSWAGSGEELIRLNSSEFKNSTSELFHGGDITVQSVIVFIKLLPELVFSEKSAVRIFFQTKIFD